MQKKLCNNGNCKGKVFHTEVKLEPRITCGNSQCRYNFQGKLSDFKQDVYCPSCGSINHVDKIPGV